MPKAPYLGKTGNVDLDDGVFGEEFHMALVHETVTAELNARRRGTSSTKTRGEVRMTGAKAFRHRESGRARASALSTPQRIGGGVAFGPKQRVFRNKVNRKARRRALRAVLSEHLRRGTLAVVDIADYDAPSTKSAATALGGFGGGRALIVLAPEGEETTVKSFRNIAGAEVRPSNAVGVSDIIGAHRLVLSQAASDYHTRIARKYREEVAA